MKPEADRPSVRIMVVEDDVVIAKQITSMLERMGYTVCATLQSGEQATAEAPSVRPDIILMDIRLKGRMDGIEAAAAIRSARDVPVVFLTAHAEAENLQRAKQTRPFGFIIKPFREIDLHAGVEMALYTARLEREGAAARDALHESEKKYRRVVETMKQGIWAMDADGRTTYVNPFMENMLGCERGEMTGRFLPDFMEAQDAEAARRDMRGLGRGLSEGLEFTFLKKNGKKVHAVLDVTPLFGEDESYAGAFAAVSDVTERRRMENELRRTKADAEAAGRAKSEFLANMSHELRTPLNAILGYAQILRRYAALPADQRKAADIIFRSGEHLLVMINDILDVSRIEAGKMTLSRKAFDLRRFLENIADIFDLRCNEKGLRFVYAASPNLPARVRGDEKRLRQVLFNLLSNAATYTPEGEVTFRVMHFRERLVFRVEDTGVGIPADKLGDIFLPFTQAPDKRAPAEGAGWRSSFHRPLRRTGQARARGRRGARPGHQPEAGAHDGGRNLCRKRAGSGQRVLVRDRPARSCGAGRRRPGKKLIAKAQ